jgi:hypothetical protein
MPRPDLLALSADDLTALTNRGTVKRAQREVETNEHTAELSEAADGTVTATWSDGATCHLPAGAVLAQGRCSCAAVGLCRHLVRTVLAYQRQAAAATPDQPPALIEPWDPGTIPDEELAKHYRPAALKKMRELFERGLLVELVRSSKPSARFHLEGCLLRFLVPGDPRYTHCDCAEPAPCSHVPLAVWSFRLLDPEQPSGILSTTATTLPVPADVLDEIEQDLEEFCGHGVSGAGPAWVGRLGRLEEACRRADLVWPAEIVAELHQEQERYAQQDALFAPDRIADLVGELLVRCDAIRNDTGALPQLLIRGARNDRPTELGKTTFVGLGCGVRLRRRGVELTAYLQASDSGGMVALCKDFTEGEPDPAKPERSFGDLAQGTAIKSTPFAALAVGQLTIQRCKRTAGCRLLPGRAEAGIVQQEFLWEKLRPPVLAEEFAELDARLAALPPSCLRPRRVAEDFHVCTVAGVAAAQFDPATQEVQAILLDARGGSAQLAHPFHARAQAGTEALLTLLAERPGDVRFVAGPVERSGAGLVFHPVCVVYEEAGRRRALQPWIEQRVGVAAGEAQKSEASRTGDALGEYLLAVQAAVGELFVLGLARADEQAALARIAAPRRGGWLRPAGRPGGGAGRRPGAEEAHPALGLASGIPAPPGPGGPRASGPRRGDGIRVSSCPSTAGPAPLTLEPGTDESGPRRGRFHHPSHGGPHVPSPREPLAMSSSVKDCVAILLHRHVITEAQLAEARDLQVSSGARLEDLLVRLGYASTHEVLLAWAESLGLAFIDLTAMTIPVSVIELIPESVARENCVLPVAVADRMLTVALADPTDLDTIQKLQFILNRDVCPILAPREQIIEAINRHYGEAETESVDSMLAEFTDSAIDFTETEATGGWPLVSRNARERSPSPGSESQTCAAERAGRVTARRATVRYYHRMCPERMFPLLVVLSDKEIQQIVKAGVVQGQSEAFRVAEGTVVEIEPILPGCGCYPPREQVRVSRGEVTTTFWVVPRVLGKVMQARVVVRQGGETLAEVPLSIRVARQRLTALMGALSLVLPFVLLVLKHFHLDFESQLQEDFGLYAHLANWAVRALTPELLTGLLLAGTAALYLWLRPRKRDVFWDVVTAGAVQTDGDVPQDSRSPVCREEAREEQSPQTLLNLADQRYRAEDFAGALPLYERALGLRTVKPIHYFRASLAAFRAGDTARALEIMQQAEASLPAARMKGEMWYNMGCFAARLGRFPEALRYLNRAVDAGYANPERYRSDPDLAVLRWHAGFKRLLAGIEV